MASSVSGQDEPNPVLWLAIRAFNMVISCPLGTIPAESGLQEKFHQMLYFNNKSFIDQDGGILAWYFFVCVYGLLVHTVDMQNNELGQYLANI